MLSTPRRRRPGIWRCRGAGDAEYQYNSGDGEGRQKATLEHVFGGLDPNGGAGGGDVSPSRARGPWAVGWQMSERNVVWNDDLKRRLVARVAAQELGMSDAEVGERLAALAVLLPDLADRLPLLAPARVAALVAGVDVVAQRLLRLRTIFPTASVSAMVAAQLSLLLDEDLDAVEVAAEKLRVLLPPTTDVDALVEAHPVVVLAVADFALALQDIARLLPGMDVATLLRTNPALVLNLMGGRNLIPYDPSGPEGAYD